MTGYLNSPITFAATTLTPARSDGTFIAHLTAGRTWQWAKQVGGYGSEIGSSIRVDNAGSVYVGGMFTDSISGRFPLVTVGSTDGMVLRFDTNGTRHSASSDGFRRNW
jgi:Beta-propeller repeat